MSNRLKSSRDNPEEKIHVAVVQHVTLRKHRDVLFFHPANGGKIGVIAAVRNKRKGVLAGIPDLCFIHKREVFFLEVKAPNGRLSPEQKQVHSDLLTAGAQVYTAYSLDEALSALKVWGLIQ